MKTMQLSLCIWLSKFSLRSNNKETDSTLQAIIRTTEAVEEALSEAEVVILHAVVVSHNTRHNKMPLENAQSVKSVGGHVTLP